jgi:ATP-dependent RNA helicase DDX51/DBP6
MFGNKRQPWKDMKGRKKRWAEEIERQIDEKRATETGSTTNGSLSGSPSESAPSGGQRQLNAGRDDVSAPSSTATTPGRHDSKVKKKRGGKKAKLEKEKWMKAKDLAMYGAVQGSSDQVDKDEEEDEVVREHDEDEEAVDEMEDVKATDEKEADLMDHDESEADHDQGGEEEACNDEDIIEEDAEDEDDEESRKPRSVATKEDQPTATPTVIPRSQTTLKQKPSKSAGLPGWLVHPITISPALTASEESSINNPSLGLSAKTITRLQNMSTHNGGEPITHLFPVQQAVIPRLLKSRYAASTTSSTSIHSVDGVPSPMAPVLGDLCVSAPTGSGKTLSYVLPILESLQTRIIVRLRALIVVPTRDLAIQVKSTFDALLASGNNGPNGIKVGMVTGSKSFLAEQKALVDLGLAPTTALTRAAWGLNNALREPVDVETSGPGMGSSKIDVLIATPGRLTDHIKSTKGFTLQHLRYLVMDEADRLLNQNYQGWLDLVLKAAAGIDVQSRDQGILAWDPLSGPPGVLRQQEEAQRKAKEMGREKGKYWVDLGFEVNALGMPLHTIHNPAAKAATAKDGANSSKSSSEGASWANYHLHSRLQKLLFSATLTRNPEKIASLHLHNPVYIAVSTPPTTGASSSSEGPQANGGIDMVHPDRDITMNQTKEESERYVAPPTLSEYMIIAADTAAKPLILLHLLFQKNLKGVLIFAKSVEAAHRLSALINLFANRRSSSKSAAAPSNKSSNKKSSSSSSSSSSEQIVASHAITSEVTPAERLKLLQQFSQGTLPILTCSDVASRGLDLGSSVTTVINYDAPLRAKTYVHRVGRTARAGRSGSTYTLVEVKEARFFKKEMTKVGRVDEEVLGSDGVKRMERKRVKKVKVSESDLAELDADYEIALGALGDIVKGKQGGNEVVVADGEEGEEEAEEDGNESADGEDGEQEEHDSEEMDDDDDDDDDDVEEHISVVVKPSSLHGKASVSTAPGDHGDQMELDASSSENANSKLLVDSFMRLDALLNRVMMGQPMKTSSQSETAASVDPVTRKLLEGWVL